MTKMVKKIAVIQDLSGFGKCSLTAAIPVISVMGVQPCPLPTAVLSAYTDLEKNGAYCTAYKSSSSSVYASTSTKDGSKKTVGVNIVLYYTKSGNTLNTGSGNSYTRGVSTTCSTPSGGTFKSATITHKLNNATVYTGYLV